MTALEVSDLSSRNGGLVNAGDADGQKVKDVEAMITNGTLYFMLGEECGCDLDHCRCMDPHDWLRTRVVDEGCLLVLQLVILLNKSDGLVTEGLVEGAGVYVGIEVAY